MRCIAGLTIALMLAWLIGVPVQAKELAHITLVQSSLSFNFVPLMIAQTAGYFEDEGIALDVVLAGGGPKAMTGLVGGGGQFSASVLFDGIMAHRRGLDDVRAMGARRSQIICKVILPSALIWIFTGMKSSVPYALIGAVVGEMMASNKGLGYMIEAAAGQYDTGGVFAALFVLMIIATGLHELLKQSERLMLRWKEDGNG